MIRSLLVFLAKALSGAGGRWLGCAPDTKQRIYFANHSSHLDALTLWSILPPEVRVLTRPVAARDYWIRGAVRRYLALEVFQAILIDRNDVRPHQNPVDQILEAMGTRGSVILFPEGGRSSGPEPMPFKGGLYHLAQRRPEIELVPVLMQNLNRILPKGEILPVPLLGHVTFGPPLSLQAGETKPDFLERARHEIIRLGNT